MFDPQWVEEITWRCLLAQNCLTVGDQDDPSARHALETLLRNDIPKMLDQIAQFHRSEWASIDTPGERLGCSGKSPDAPRTRI